MTSLAQLTPDLLWCIALATIALFGCENAAEQPLPPVQVQGEFLSYASDVEVCPGTVTQSENWMRAVAERLGIPENEIVPVTYYRLDRDSTMERCEGGSGCAQHYGDEIRIFSSNFLDKHELVHALHLSAWPDRQPLLQEGLATTFDDGLPQRFPFSGSAEEASALIEVESPHDDIRVYSVGAYLFYWVGLRHGPESLADFWMATDPAASASDFLSTFAGQFDEPLDAMLADVAGQSACQVVTCVGTPEPWVDGVWTADIPQGCDDDRVVGIAGELLWRHDLIEVPQNGIYELSVSAGEASISACAMSCSLGFGDFATITVPGGSASEVSLESGLYRIETLSSGSSPGEVQIQQVE